MRIRMSSLAAALCLAIAAGAVYAVGAVVREVEVFVVRFPGGASDERYRFMDLPAAARFLSPVAFSARGGTLKLQSELSAGILERGRVVLAGRPGGSLERVSVLQTAPEREVRPGKTVTVSFTLDELLVRGGPWSGVPAAWACYRAVSDCGWNTGSVWARSVSFDARTGKITVRVALLK